eukprot:GABV01002684.1.p1 GENE.GABV01002684.1~~GABV01002684.1.p1  ORF type:complete len:192 (+),score=31.18 GABV01002684.1:73-576(+)
MNAPAESEAEKQVKKHRAEQLYRWIVPRLKSISSGLLQVMLSVGPRSVTPWDQLDAEESDELVVPDEENGFRESPRQKRARERRRKRAAAEQERAKHVPRSVIDSRIEVVTSPVLCDDMDPSNVDFVRQRDIMLKSRSDAIGIFQIAVAGQKCACADSQDSESKFRD